ncbi:MAG: hypothetical protein IPK82_31170 [Polyangiaceae bacterium]|nr:hypothetical protein [Polyangiaceae bacterium]
MTTPPLRFVLFSAASLWLLSNLTGCESQVTERGSGGGLPCPSEQWHEFLTLPESSSGGSNVELSVQCLPRVPVGDVSGAYPCVIVEGRMDDECNCDKGRTEVNSIRQSLVDELKANPDLPNYNCFCEVVQLTEAEGEECRSNPTDSVEVNGQPLHGFCVVSSTDKTADLEVLQGCGNKSPGGIRFVGDPQEPHGQTYSMLCNTTTCASYPHE